MVSRWLVMAAISCAVFLLAMFFAQLPHDSCVNQWKSKLPAPNLQLLPPQPVTLRLAVRSLDSTGPAGEAQDHRKGYGSVMTEEREVNPPVATEVFGMLGHPASPGRSEVLVRRAAEDSPPRDFYSPCEQLYLTRTGSLVNMPNKCLALSFVSSAEAAAAQHRRGLIAGLRDMYRHDYVDERALAMENIFLAPIIAHLPQLVSQFSEVAGRVAAVVVMVINEGVLDLFLNFVCSLRSARLMHLLSKVVVFVAQPELRTVLAELGVARVFSSEFFGKIPAEAAGEYGDNTFGLLMWLKALAVYIPVASGYEVLFQDVDMVWMEDPLPELAKFYEDIIFMDDGARTPRFSPFFFNSGFYLVRPTASSRYLMERMLRSVSTIAMTHSHQSVLTKEVHEVVEAHGLTIRLLNITTFPSGYMFHHNHLYLSQMKTFQVLPKVFHICWTKSRTEKVEYLKLMGLWHLDEGQCEKSSEFRLLVAQLNREGIESPALSNKCCQSSEYWANRTSHFSSMGS